MFFFLWSQNAPALSVPEHTRSLDWDCVVSEGPPAPSNTLEYDLDPIQELFSNPIYEREVAWAQYKTDLTKNLLTCLSQHGAPSLDS